GTPIAPAPAQQIFNFVHNCSSLHIEVPTSHSFEPLLSLHRALQSGALKSVTHIQFEGLNAAGLLALRWGGFDAFAESTWISASIWRGLTSLSISMKCKDFKLEVPKPDDQASQEEIEKYRKDRQTYRQTAQILHNYFFHFAREGRLEKLQFDWIDGIGPNPLLLDVEITMKDDQAWRWFSAPGLKWTSLRDVRLGGVETSGFHVKEMKEHITSLETLKVWEDIAGQELLGKMEKIDGKYWLDVDLQADISEPLEIFDEVEDLEFGQSGQSMASDRSRILASNMDDLHTWVSDKLIQLTGASDSTVVDFVLATGNSAKSSSALQEKLSNFLDGSQADLDRFSSDLYQRLPKQNGASANGHPTRGEKEQAVRNVRKKYQLLEMEDDIEPVKVAKAEKPEKKSRQIRKVKSSVKRR
ncbi:MAG: hypothetical protein Q9174_007112, partial [Haloplaca sp. 1 TL-2023]